MRAPAGARCTPVRCHSPSLRSNGVRLARLVRDCGCTPSPSSDTSGRPCMHDDPQLLAIPLNELEDQLVMGAMNRTVSKHRLLRLLAEFDRRGGWVVKGATSCSVWWAEVCGIEHNTAREQLRVARALGALSALDDALASGQLSSSARCRWRERNAGRSRRTRLDCGRRLDRRSAVRWHARA